MRALAFWLLFCGCAMAQTGGTPQWQGPPGPAGIPGTSYSDAQAVAAAQAGLTGFSSPNISMPNGANLVHTIYATTGNQTINNTTDTTVFSTSGVGNQTVPAAAFFPGAVFEFRDFGVAATGALNTATVAAKVLFGSTVITSSATSGLPVNLASIPFSSDVMCVVLTGGVNGSVKCFGNVSVSTGLVGTPSNTYLTTTNAVLLNLSAPLKLDATASFSNLTGSPTMTIYFANIVQVN